MSLTLPTNYANASKSSNIQENWIIQLGFNESFDIALNGSDSSNNLASEAIDGSETEIDVDRGADFTAGDYIKIDNEIMLVSSILSNTLTVVREVRGTTAATHDNDSKIFFDNYVGISLGDAIVSDVFYHGAVANEPRIRTNVDVFKSKASTSQISISIINFKYQGNDFSEELLYGSRSYINRTVRIYSQLNNSSSLSDCLQIFEGRFVDISHNNERITLSVVEQRPWDFIQIPNQRTISSNNQTGIPTYFPVAYGDFQANISYQGAEALCHANLSGQDTNLYPIPVHNYDANEFFCLAAESNSGSQNSATSVTAHFYEPNIDSFIPLLNSSGNTYVNNTSSYQGGNTITAPLNMFRAFRFKPTNTVGSNEFTVSEYDAFETVVGTSRTGLSTSTANHPPEIPTQPFTDSDDEEVYQRTVFGYYNMPIIDGRIIYIQILIKGYASIQSTASATTMSVSVTETSNNLTLASITSGASSASTLYHQPFGGTGAAQTGSAALGTFTSSDLYTSSFNSGDISIRASYTWTVGNLSDLKTGATAGNCYISDIHYLVRSKLQFDATNMSTNIERLNKMKVFYTGANGLNKSYTGGSGTASKGIEAHRDMLFRYAGFDAADSDIYNWSSGLNIASARTDWNIAYWLLEPKPLKEVLQQAQNEFAFWFKWRADGSASYWYVKNSYASGDLTQTFDLKDIASISIRNTSWKDLVTKYDIEYKRHPAKNSRYIKSLSSIDFTNNTRAAYNIQTKENTKSIKLDMNINKAGDSDVGDNDPNDGFSNYYINLSGVVRKIIAFKAVNVAKAYNLETGDIINFSSTSGDMPVKPFGHNWNESGSQYYMIIELQRSRGSINIKCLEVG